MNSDTPSTDGNEPTLVMGNGRTEAPAGAAPAAALAVSTPPEHSGNTLPIGHLLQEYVIEGLIGEGGFGIVYLARDTQLGRVVALKEYMPSSLAARSTGHQVSVRSERHRETFELGRRSFVNEAQLLAAFDQPSLVKVYRFWEANGTAYMVMPFYEGPTLKQWLVEKGTPPDEAWLLSLLYPLMDALELMHHNQCYHRDIAPDNILLLKPSNTQMGSSQAVRPVLLDFGAARRVIGDATQALTVILKPGYAPIEQYAESSTMKQGSWTDVYALSAVLYAAITGRAPMPSVSRIVTDDLVPAAQAGAGRYSPQFLAAIDAGLQVRPDNRPQNMAALRAMFAGLGPGLGNSTTQAHNAPTTQAFGSVTAPRPPDSSDQQTMVLPSATPAGSKQPEPAKPTAPTPAAGSRRPLALAGGVVAVLAAIGIGWVWMGSQSGAPVTPPVAAAPTPQVPITGNPVPVAPPTAPTVAAVVPPPAPFTVMSALQDIVRGSDPLLGVNVLADKSVVNIGKDRLQFRVKAAEAGYLYVFLSGTDKAHFYLLFPNGIDKNNRIEANQEILLPRKSWQITAGGPPGTNHIVAMVARHPRDLSDVGLGTLGEEIPEFDLARAEQLWAKRQSGMSPFIGKPSCDAGVACDAGYGASLLTIDEVNAK